MTVAEAQTLIYRYGFDSNDPTLQWINMAKDELLDEGDWSWLYKSSTGTLTANTNTITLPTDLVTLIGVEIYDSVGGFQKLKERSSSYLSRERDVYAASTYRTTGIPFEYARFGTTLKVYPTPDVNYSYEIQYQMSVADYVSGTMGTVPTSLHSAIVYRAVAIGLMSENEEERAATAQQQYEQRVAKAWSKDSSDMEEPDQVTDVMDYGSDS